MLPLFEQGPEKLNEILEGAKEAGISLTSSQTEAGHGFMEQYKAMTASVEGLKIAIGNELFPVFAPVIEGMREILNEHRAEIAKDIGKAVKYISDNLKGIKWDNVKADIKEFGKDVEWVVGKIGGIGPAIALVAAFTFAPTIMELGALGPRSLRPRRSLCCFPLRRSWARSPRSCQRSAASVTRGSRSISRWTPTLSAPPFSRPPCWLARLMRSGSTGNRSRRSSNRYGRTSPTISRTPGR